MKVIKLQIISATLLDFLYLQPKERKKKRKVIIRQIEIKIEYKCSIIKGVIKEKSPKNQPKSFPEVRLVELTIIESDINILLNYS